MFFLHINNTHTKDNEMQNETGYIYDEFGRVIEKTYTQNNTPVSIKNSYDKYGNVSTTSVTIGSVVDSYENTYDYSNPESKHISTKIGNVTETYGYDKLGRIKETQLGSLYSKHFNYLQKGNYTSNLVASEWFGKNGIIKESLKYSYDQNGNIIKVFENGELIQSFEYDGISRLIRENNKKLNKTTTFEYDAGGNIVRKIEYGYTTVATDNLSGGSVIPYTYPTSGWKDQLLSYNFETIEYDALGNPITYRNNDLSWSHGRQLDSFNDITYKYNADGIRTSKTVNGVTTQYFLDGTKILAQNNGNMLVFHYGGEGVIGFTYQGIGEYYYKKNIFGDVIGIIDNNGQEIAKYVYDSWGNHKTYVLNNGIFVDILVETSYTQSGLNNKLIAQISPFRYRSYYYDTETGLYYLNSRYYDPEIGRFINADKMKNAMLQIVKLSGLNLYAYCLNNPVMMIDNLGQFALSVFRMQLLNQIVGKKKNVALLFANDIKIASLGKENKNHLPFANVVTRFSYTESLIQNSFFAALIGNLSYTVTYQVKQQGWFYGYYDIGNGYIGYGAGINLNNTFNIEIGVTAGSFWDLGINSSVSFGNLSVGGSIGTSGIGLNFGFTNGNTTTTVGGTVGWGTIGFATFLLLVPDPTGLTKIAASLILFFDWLF